jgi:hypothetical protein
VALIVVGAAPVRIRKVAAGGKVRDAAGVVVSLSQVIAGLACKEFRGPAANANLERIALEVSL